MMITDPADRMTADFIAALESRYADVTPVYLGVEDFAARYARACDAVVQMLWPEKYGTNPADPLGHTSDPARAIARVMFAAVGLTDDEPPSGG
jgi:hypothetical protein